MWLKLHLTTFGKLKNCPFHSFSIILSYTSCARIASWVRFLHVFRQWTSVNLWPRPYRDSDLNAVSPLCFDIGSVAPTLYRTMMWVLCLLVFCLQNLWFCCGSFLFQDIFFLGGWLGIFSVFGPLVFWSPSPLFFFVFLFLSCSLFYYLFFCFFLLVFFFFC